MIHLIAKRMIKMAIELQLKSQSLLMEQQYKLTNPVRFMNVLIGARKNSPLP